MTMTMPAITEPISKPLTSLQRKIDTRKARVGVLGLGYVGLPLAVELAGQGFAVTGFDVDPARLQTLSKKKSHIADISDSVLGSVIDQKRFTVTTNFSRLETMDVVIICVPTPLNKTKEPDMSYVERAADQVSKYSHKHQLIVLESTSYPGTTRECFLPKLEAQGLRIGKDVFLAFSPERIDPGNGRFSLSNTPKVVGGLTPACRDLAVSLYRNIIPQVIPVSSAEAAEMVKILENTFRAVNIGLINEMALVCDKLNLNIWEIIDAAATKPYGFMPFYPGPGLGGHCIPVDPHYLSWKMKGLNFSTRFIELAGEVNSHMPEFVINKTARAFNERKMALNGATILLMGVAYKANVSDVRESPALDLFHLFTEQGAKVSFHDPYVSSMRIEGRDIAGKPLSTALLKSVDAVIITTAHREFDPAEILRNARLVIDTRNLMRGLQAPNLIPL